MLGLIDPMNEENLKTGWWSLKISEDKEIHKDISVSVQFRPAGTNHVLQFKEDQNPFPAAGHEAD